MTSRYAITRATRPRRLAAGFTLIELIIVTVIVAILASVAIPSYTHYVQRNHRATVQALLADIASRQQQFFLNRRQFGSLSDLGVTVPADVASHYNVITTCRWSPPCRLLVHRPLRSRLRRKVGKSAITAAR